MKMTKRDITEIVFIWVGLAFIPWVVSDISFLIQIASASENTPWVSDYGFTLSYQVAQTILILVSMSVCLFGRSKLATWLVPDGGDKEVSVSDGLTVLTSYAFWIRLLGIYTLLHTTLQFVGQVGGDFGLATKGSIAHTYRFQRSATQLIAILLAIVMIRKAEWLAIKLGKTQPANQASDATDESAPGADSSAHQG